MKSLHPNYILIPKSYTIFLPITKFPKPLYISAIRSLKPQLQIHSIVPVHTIIPMKDKGKSVKPEQGNANIANIFSDPNYFSSSSDLPCKKHPSNPSPVGICAYCLKEKLIELVCSDCGEQRISSCSCSDLSSYRNSSYTVGSVGRVSFLIENENGSDEIDKKTGFSQMKVEQSETEDVCLLKRSSSCVVEVKRSNGFWGIGKLFKKKKEKQGLSEGNSVMNVSRSRSISSFKDGNFCHESSSAKISDFSESGARKSGIRGGLMDIKSGFAVKESDFCRIVDNNDDEFIDLKFDETHGAKIGYPVFKKCDSLDSTVNGSGIKKMKNGNVKSWKWIFKHHDKNECC